MLRLLFRLLLRLWFVILLFVLGRLFGAGAGRGRFETPGDARDAGPGDSVGSSRGARPSRRSRARGAIPPIDRSDVVDVPFTEIPPAPGPVSPVNPVRPARPAAGGS